MAGIEWDDDLQCIKAAGHVPTKRNYRGQFEFEFPLYSVRDVRLGAVCDVLAQALRALKNGDRYIEMTVSYDVLVYPYPRTAPYGSDVYSLDSVDGPMRVGIECEITPDVDHSSAAKLVADFASSLGWAVAGIDYRYTESGEALAITLDLQPDFTIGEIARSAQAMRRALLGIDASLEDPVTLSYLIKRSRGDVLLGLPESGIFDAKAVPYALKSDIAKLEFALDVAAFANGRGGVIVVGARTRTDGSTCRDVVEEVAGFDISRSINIAQHRDVLANMVYPPVESVDFVDVPLAGDVGRLLIILIPPQRPPSRLFIVKKSRSDFCIPVRRGDRKEYFTVEELHAMIAGQ